jgi:hypothetical protein
MWRRKRRGETVRILMGRGGFKEVVDLPTFPQHGGGKGIDIRTYSEV